MTAPAYALYGPLLHIKVRGNPVGQGGIRHLGAGRPAVHANAKTLKPWRAQIQAAVEDEMRYRQEYPIPGPVAVDVTFTMPKPKAAPKRRRTWPERRPDIDHLLRACLDAVVAAGAIRDDAQVVEVRTRKAFPGEHPKALLVPGLQLVLFAVGDDHAAAVGDRQEAL